MRPRVPPEEQCVATEWDYAMGEEGEWSWDMWGYPFYDMHCAIVEWPTLREWLTAAVVAPRA